jgi:hypothetical protein
MKTTIEQMENIHHAGDKHFIITRGKKKYFQSYNTLVAVCVNGKVTLNKDYYNYSKTTAAYLNRFLGVTQKEKIKKIESGEYKLKVLDSRILCELNPNNLKH